MKKNLLLTAVLIALFLNAVNAQTTFDFESLAIPSAGYWNGSDDSGSFGNSETVFSNDFNSDYQSWSGFSYAYDTIVSDVQYALYSPERKAYSGHIFGIGYVPMDWEGGTYENIPIEIGFETKKNISAIFIANDSTTVDVIVNGNSFGTAPFSDGDYFKIIISGINGTTLTTETVEYYLADFRSGLNYIENNWVEIDLSTLGAVDGLVFNLESSDIGAYGMNTPAYFCVDDILYTNASFVETNSADYVGIYPNPAKNIVNISNIFHANISINDITGKVVFSKNNCSETERINVSNFTSGVNFVRISHEDDIVIRKIVVQ